MPCCWTARLVGAGKFWRALNRTRCWCVGRGAGRARSLGSDRSVTLPTHLTTHSESGRGPPGSTPSRRGPQWRHAGEGRWSAVGLGPGAAPHTEQGLPRTADQCGPSSAERTVTASWEAVRPPETSVRARPVFDHERAHIGSERHRGGHVVLPVVVSGPGRILPAARVVIVATVTAKVRAIMPAS
jgi:hypothetical protein